ncbi:long-chain-fatty-acid--CoA ligase [Caenorhabditis elegans]|uniref:long-chain-fatty-acid--CoA ligase n=1 Tax=Caenorhabditis elegans TaxID=6239 RepID=Q20121_CAEEL|nr:AMP-binding domain-containing protein [Caenorhabditis elegans]CCD70738.1 AMP-binding domain-containing protein [Caenorhabditis elegans]|eukprot:NP_498568.1 fatty Acid CoA Synthetase family [Caenorhabditis elegans]
MKRKVSVYDSSKDKTLGQVVKGESPIWIRVAMAILRVWFFIYDCLNYLPYQLFNSPTEKLRKSERVKANWVDDRDGPIRNIQGHASETFPGKDTVDKVWRKCVELYDESPCLGTRQLIEVHEDKQPGGRVFEKWHLGEYVWQSYKEVETQVARLAAGIKDLAHEEQNPKVVIFAETRADWLITALACFRANVTIVTVYATLGEDAIAHAIGETEATILVTSSELLPKIVTLGKKCPTLKTLIYFAPVDQKAPAPELAPFRDQFKHVLSLSGLLTRNQEQVKESTAVKSDIALIMYTSGTTGQPKGVILLHQNVVAALLGQGDGVGIICNADTYIGYLPLAHILELDAELTCLTKGAKVGYSSPLTLHDRASKIQKGTHGDCHALRPTLMAAVPAIMDRIFKAVSEEVAASPRFMQELFKLNYERKRSRYLEGYCSPFLDRIVFKKIRRLLGGKLRGVLSGGAPLNAETQRFMNICMCCPVVQGYGLTETCGAACVADINDLSTGTVGPPVRCSDIALREWSEGGYSPFNDPPQGEILISGENISPGYYKQPEKTAEDFITYKGKVYFATGDIGQKRDDGSLLIIDRKKDLVKLQHGEYVSLAKVECALLNCPIVDNICVYGSGMEDSVVALVVPNQKHLEKIAEAEGVSTSEMKTMCEDKKVIAAYKKQLEEHAKKSKLSRSEIPAAIHLCPEIWTPDTGLLTEALKLKRKPIQMAYQKTLDDLYKQLKKN